MAVLQPPAFWTARIGALRLGRMSVADARHREDPLPDPRELARGHRPEPRLSVDRGEAQHPQAVEHLPRADPRRGRRPLGAGLDHRVPQAHLPHAAGGVRRTQLAIAERATDAEALAGRGQCELVPLQEGPVRTRRHMFRTNSAVPASWPSPPSAMSQRRPSAPAGATLISAPARVACATVITQNTCTAGRSLFVLVHLHHCRWSEPFANILCG